MIQLLSHLYCKGMLLIVLPFVLVLLDACIFLNAFPNIIFVTVLLKTKVIGKLANIYCICHCNNRLVIYSLFARKVLFSVIFMHNLQNLPLHLNNPTNLSSEYSFDLTR